MVVLLLWMALSVPQWACGVGEAGPLRVNGWTKVRALNESLEIDFSADLDPLSATRRSVRVVTDEGALLAHRLEVRGSKLLVTLLLDERFVREPPRSLQVRLSGWPSVHALKADSGAELPAALSLDVSLDARLSDTGRVRLESINGRSAEETGRVTHGGSIRLAFEGVIDPGSVTPGNCPLFPVVAGLQLKPLLPDTRWSLVGSRCEILLVVPPGSGPLELIWKRLGLRGLDGRSCEGPLVVTLTSS